MTPAQAPAAAKASPFTAEQKATLVAWTQRFPYPAMGLLEALREVQEWHHHVSLEDEAFIAGLFGVTLHHVHEVVTFYPFYTTKPAGTYRIDLCRNVSCHLAGAHDAAERFKTKLGIDEGERTSDGRFSFEEVECLGACDHAPAFAINDELIGAATPEAIDGALASCRAGTLPDLPPLPALKMAASNGTARILTEHFDDPDLHTLAAYRKYGGYQGWEKAKTMSAVDIMGAVQQSNLRGLGGAGFPSGMKWATVPSKKDRNVPHYLVANADESEPGCFKDRVLMERNPHALIEGLLISGKAIDADGIYIFIRGEYARARRILLAAIEEAKAAGILEGKEILITRGANAYISGCDTALLETMEGKKAWPRQPPPFPTVSGVMGNPTVVNNVETLMMTGPILAKGAAWFAGLGVPKSGGTAVYSVSGHVRKAGVHEFPMGTPLKTILDAAGGLNDGRTLKAVIPGGTSTPVLTAEQALGAKMDFDSLRSLGTFLGAGGVIALDDTTDMVETLRIIERFLAHESCGQCTPCREGSIWVARVLGRMLEGKGDAGDLDNLLRMGDNISGKVICALGETVGPVAKSMIGKFRPEFEARLKAS
ncbi:MAG: NADH-quinone oxidoreductase subunit NuoF [Elusimicrobia bacterium]|nr:NADH-quinone oxidoreductase subunit NuoF [Elusimicrobiota bacterium]